MTIKVIESEEKQRMKSQEWNLESEETKWNTSTLSFQYLDSIKEFIEVMQCMQQEQQDQIAQQESKMNFPYRTYQPLSG